MAKRIKEVIEDEDSSACSGEEDDDIDCFDETKENERRSLMKNKKEKNEERETKEEVICEGLKKLNVGSSSKKTKTTLDEPTFRCFIKSFQEKGFKSIITIVGAGISTAAGIPDFRSSNRGLYDNLAKYKLPHPQSIFEIDYFKKNPAAFFDLAKQLIPDKFKPTISHYFIKLLETKGLLLRHYTQNVDGLERKAGICDDKLIEAHGTFYTSHCLKCSKSYSFEWMKQEMMATGVPTCIICTGIVKPDIVFFGENLPKKFFDCMRKDFEETDLLIIMGSTLVVEPFASLVRRVDRTCPRIIINHHEVGRNVGISYDPRHNKRDVFLKGSCDEGCMDIVDGMGWNEEFDLLRHQMEQSLDEGASVSF